MDIFELRERLVQDYSGYTRSFIKIADDRILKKVEDALNEGQLWPQPLLQLNPTFLPGGSIDDLVADGTLHEECQKIFRIGKSDEDHVGKPLGLHTHQVDAIRQARTGRSYVLTSGTGSGKSLTYIVPIVDHVLRRGSGKGIQAIVVYPMNALANSQEEELKKFLQKGYEKGKEPVRFARYTGQERGPEREEIQKNPPDILLTNYMMLELMLTRRDDRALIQAAQGLRFLVFDELHTYRGRQGADIALLVRRCRFALGGDDLICIGTSATMASGGSTATQRQAVSEVACRLFGAEITSDQVIGETLERATPELDYEAVAIKEELAKAVSENTPPPDEYESFKDHPLASWIESTFGVRSEEGSGHLIRQKPRTLKGRDSASLELAKVTGCDPDACYDSLRTFLAAGAEKKANDARRFPIFAFRLHQFFTRGDTVWSTLENESERHLELSKLVSKPGEPEKPLFPVVFCRQCGTAYYRVSMRQDEHGSYLLAREDRREEGDDGSGDAYLHISTTDPWPASDGSELLERLPAFMKEFTAAGEERVKPDERNNLPQPVFVTPAGRIVSEGEGLRATIIRKNFLFCLCSECGVAYAKNQRSERAKLATLGIDNRSTATTILAVRTLIELQGDISLDKEARKLLSFTDNRQDASLQAGHFNDFAQVSLLRSALYKAVSLKGEQGLTHGELSRAVFDAMALPFEEYASDPDIRGPGRHSTHDALRRVLDYYLYRDLQRGWRVTAPNLEDCGLLCFEYEGLTGADGLLDDEEVWTVGIKRRINRTEEEQISVSYALSSLPGEIRGEILYTLLDYLRRSMAIKADVLNPHYHRELVEQTRPRLQQGTVWYLDEPQDLVHSEIAYPRARTRGDRNGLFISSYGNLGKYIKRVILEHGPSDVQLGRDHVDEIIQYLFLALKRYGIVEQVRDADVPGYQLNPAALRWLQGSGEFRPVDRTRILNIGESPPEVNPYFVECYKRFIDLKCVLEAREHTAQVTSDERQEREDRFRVGELPLLFCSPTMELGVDISQLNVVNMRNVPPTPANYAQRSGRAGRGGQPALVYTYCAGRSPHDQYYFRQPDRMVAGVVSPPSIDLCNRDLIRSHIHAIWMEAAKPDLGKTLTTVIDIQREEGKIHLPVKKEMRDILLNPAHRAAAFNRATQLVESMRPYLASATWFHENWLNEVFDRMERSFEESCERWRSLYRAAVRQRELHHKIIADHARPEEERNHSRRLRAQAESQIKLLTEAEGVYEGDFYSYRYFAAEGFLPGYNFPRLPISAYVPARRGRKGRDEFVSRPRFLAISEFGPRALIYHEGARYRVYKVNLDFGNDDVEATHSLVTATMKRCPACGYAHIEQEKNMAENCERCQAPLEPDTMISNLVMLQNASLKLAQRITCDEEERQRFGYKMVLCYRFPAIAGKLDRVDAEVRVGEHRVMQLSYGDSTDLYRINLGWANQKPTEPAGFRLDLERGYWARNQADADDQDEAKGGRIERVVPYVTDTKNALVMRFDPVRAPHEMAALQAAFKEAIQKHFQLEPRELAAAAMPSNNDRREILFYEAAEGGAGVLRQLVEDPRVIPALARCALELCHFNPDTLEDRATESCGKACYECLLDYANQPDHPILDRFSIRDLLSELAGADCKPAGGTGTREERMQALRKVCDSKLEQYWLDLIDDLMLRPPSDAQYLIESCSTRPDFYCREYNAAIYVDGPPHDEPEQIRKDEEITARLKQASYIVIRFHHKADWLSIIRQHPDIFGAPQA